MAQVQSSFLQGGSGLAPYPSDTEMREEAQESRIRRHKSWSDDRRATRDLYRQQQASGVISATIPTAAIVPSRIQCEGCGVYIEAEMRGSKLIPKSVYFYVVGNRQRVKLATKTSLLHSTILLLCGECAARKLTPTGIKGLPAEYAVVKPADWSRFASQTDMKCWLWWRRILCECVLFGYPFFLPLLNWLQSQPEEEENASPPSLSPFATLQLPPAPANQERETLVPSAQMLLLFEQQRLSLSSHPEEQTDNL